MPHWLHAFVAYCQAVHPSQLPNYTYLHQIVDVGLSSSSAAQQAAAAATARPKEGTGAKAFRMAMAAEE